jgi:hypothetical protein
MVLFEKTIIQDKILLLLGMNPNKLTVTINNNTPVSVHDFANALKGLGSEYNRFLHNHTDIPVTEETKLYVKEIRKGSIIVELMDKAPMVLPLIAGANTIIEFGKFLQKSFNYFLGKESKPHDFTIQDCNNLSAIIKPTVHDNASQTIFTASDGGTINVTFNLDSTEAKKIESEIAKEILTLKTADADTDLKEKVILSFSQTKKDLNSTTGTRGIIDSLFDKALNVIFENEALAREILHGENNPLKTAFVVDATIETVNQKPVAFKVYRLHESFSIED